MLPCEQVKIVIHSCGEVSNTDKCLCSLLAWQAGSVIPFLLSKSQGHLPVNACLTSCVCSAIDYTIESLHSDRRNP
jgi:hypothetical protein